MHINKIVGICVITLICLILCTGNISAVDNTNTTTHSLSDEQGELQITDSNMNNNEKLESNRVADYSYDNELEIQVKNTSITKIHTEKYVFDKKGYDISCSENNEFPEKDIVVRVVNLDYNSSDQWSTMYPANLKITFKIYENGKYLSNFTGYTDAYGYANFSSSILPNRAGTYNIIASYPGDQRYFSFGNGTHQTIYNEYLSTEQKFNIAKLNPKEHKYTITAYWKGQKYTVNVKLSNTQYQSLKTAKKNKKSKSIIGIHTKTYVTLKKTVTKKLVIYKITQNKKTGKIKKTWTKKWKSKTKKLIKQGYKSKIHKKLGKYKGKIWITFKKTIKKKYEIKASALTVAKNGQYKKGDYITLYGPEPLISQKINIS